jgi:hypothetical protein
MAQFQVNQGTQTQLANDVVGTNTYPSSKIDIGAAGVSVPWLGQITSGTITQLPPVAITTIASLAAGTITTGTVDSVSQLPLNSFGTSINTAGTAFGTIKAAVAGSSIYITDLTISMSVVSGTIALYNGANSNLLAGSWAFNANGGLVNNYRVPIQGLSGSALCYQQQGTASVGITAQGFVR